MEGPQDRKRMETLLPGLPNLTGKGTNMESKRHFIIIEVETATEQSAKMAEDMVGSYVRAIQPQPSLGFTFKSVGWIADNVREAPTGKQDL